MARKWCNYERQEFDESEFTNGPNGEVHLNREPLHTTSGFEVKPVAERTERGPRPAPARRPEALGASDADNEDLSRQKQDDV